MNIVRYADMKVILSVLHGQICRYEGHSESCTWSDMQKRSFRVCCMARYKGHSESAAWPDIKVILSLLHGQICRYIKVILSLLHGQVCRHQGHCGSAAWPDIKVILSVLHGQI